MKTSKEAAIEPLGRLDEAKIVRAALATLNGLGVSTFIELCNRQRQLKWIRESTQARTYLAKCSAEVLVDLEVCIPQIVFKMIAAWGLEILEDDFRTLRTIPDGE